MSDDLRSLQRALQAHVLNGDAQIAREIAGSARADGATRLRIYSDAYRLRLLEALAVDFPALHTLAGDERFERIGREYIEHHPSQHFSIRYFGEHLADFLRDESAYRDLPVLSEMAAFEWALAATYDAADRAPLREADLAAFPPDAWPYLRLALHPSVRRLDLAWNVPALWRAATGGQDPRTPEAEPAPVAWVLWRHELQSYFRSLGPAEAWALGQLDKHCPSFAELCTGLCDWVPQEDVPLQSAILLKRWVGEGIVCIAQSA